MPTVRITQRDVKPTRAKSRTLVNETPVLALVAAAALVLLIGRQRTPSAAQSATQSSRTVEKR